MLSLNTRCASFSGPAVAHVFESSQNQLLTEPIAAGCPVNSAMVCGVTDSKQWLAFYENDSLRGGSRKLIYTYPSTKSKYLQSKILRVPSHLARYVSPATSLVETRRGIIKHKHHTNYKPQKRCTVNAPSSTSTSKLVSLVPRIPAVH